MKLRGAPAPVGWHDKQGTWKEEEREGRYTVGSPVADRLLSLPVAAVSIRTKGGLGHAYAILAPGAVHGSRSGYDKPALLAGDGVLPVTLGPGAFAPGPSS
ncbi:hypothetical protein Cs7R123_05260 [Catellatospora sp. TT07R-123]|nr:hypothetical protein Cs7R123_05260 [Catellatospora sp. TT07R-123]